MYTLILYGFKIRKALKSDIKAIMQMENEGFVNGIKESEDIFIERINIFSDGFLILSDENNIPVGYISSEIWNYKDKIDENDFTLEHSIKTKHDYNGNELYISSMVLSNKLKGKGWGHILLYYLIDNIRESYPNIKSVVLIVCNNWKSARKIYINKGFEEVYSIKDFFKPISNLSRDGIVMRKTLS